MGDQSSKTGSEKSILKTEPNFNSIFSLYPFYIQKTESKLKTEVEEETTKREKEDVEKKEQRIFCVFNFLISFHKLYMYVIQYFYRYFSELDLFHPLSY